MSAQRKDEHLRLAESLRGAARPNGFDDVAFLHHSIGTADWAEVGIGTTVLGASWALPFYINAMTGGTDRARRINAALGRAAGATGVAIACGSQRVALAEPALADGFRAIRDGAPDAFVFANVGPTVDPGQAVRAVDMLGADALQVHVNPAQELVMPEGGRRFSDWPERIADIAAAVPVPVVVKEVGCGLSRSSMEALVGRGIRAFDVSGTGGTDFVDIENHRRDRSEFGYLTGWGQSAAFCLLEALHAAPGPVDAQVLASGGVRTPLDVVRALALGAQAVGVSGTFLHTLLAEGEDALVAQLRSWADQVRTLLSLLGCRDLADVRGTDVLITGRTAELARLRGIDLGALARRG